MNGSRIHAGALCALFSALSVVPLSSRATGLLDNLLHQAATTLAHKVENAAGQHPGPVAHPAQAQTGGPAHASSAAPDGLTVNGTFHPNTPECQHIDQSRQCLLVLKTTASPHLTIGPKVGFDILGVRPGMSATQAEAILARHYGSASRISRGQASSTHKDVVIKSHPYVVSETYGGNSPGEDSTTVYFSSPASGHVVELITRVIGTGQSALSTRQVIAELDRKYGPQTPPAVSATAASQDPTLNWIYGRNGGIHDCGYLSTACWCPGNAAGATSAGPPSGTVPGDYVGRSGISHGQYECVQAYLGEPYGDTTKVEGLTLTVDAPVIEYLDSAQAIGQLHTAAVEVYRHEHHAKLPTL